MSAMAEIPDADCDEFDRITDQIEVALAPYDNQLCAMILVSILGTKIGAITDVDDRLMTMRYASDMILAIAGWK